MNTLKDRLRRAIRPAQREVLDRSANRMQAITTENEDHWRGQPYAVSLPNFALREASSTGDLGSWYAIGEAWAQIAASFLPPSPTVLDLGCGCGKMARFFVLIPDLRYLGLDVFQPSIYWCNREFARHADRFRFEHLDVVSQLYNPGGSTRGAEVRLPVDDASMDMVICGSLFTHLLEPVFRHYLTEVRRCLAPRGAALISLHMEPANGRFDGDEARIDISDPTFAKFCADASLRIDARIGNVYGQQVFVVRRAEAAA
jgi:SAM-dependent methyltransferase